MWCECFLSEQQTWQLRWSGGHKPQSGRRSAVWWNWNKKTQRIKMNPAGYVRWRRLWKHESFYTLTPLFPNHTHKRRRDIYRSRLDVSGRRLAFICSTEVHETLAASHPLSAGLGVKSGVTSGCSSAAFRDVRLPAERWNAASGRPRRRMRCRPAQTAKTPKHQEVFRRLTPD